MRKLLIAAAGAAIACSTAAQAVTVVVFVDPMTGWRDQPLNTREWYCRGVGLVKLERSEPSSSPMLIGGSRTLELEEWR